MRSVVLPCPDFVENIYYSQLSGSPTLTDTTLQEKRRLALVLLYNNLAVGFVMDVLPETLTFSGGYIRTLLPRRKEAVQVEHQLRSQSSHLWLNPYPSRAV